MEPRKQDGETARLCFVKEIVIPRELSRMLKEAQAECPGDEVTFRKAVPG